MTLGGFAASVQITKSSISGGMHEGNNYFVKADMELEGKILVANFSVLKEKLNYKSKSEVFIEIEFVENLETGFNYLVVNDIKYIGKIHLSEINNGVRSFVRITLPFSMFPLLRSMNRKTIQFDTIHDVIKNPNEEQRLDNVVAYVKRVNFETSNDDRE
jgi:hypothetical protein